MLLVIVDVVNGVSGVGAFDVVEVVGVVIGRCCYERVLCRWYSLML